MAFQHSLYDLIANADERNVLFRSLMQAIVDHGGDTHHLNALLADARDGRRHFDALAKKLIGRIWELVEQPVDLGAIDFACPIPQFLTQYPGVEIAFGTSQNRCPWTETQPRGACRYKLAHFSRPRSFQEVVDAFPVGGAVESAGFRELVAYVSRLQVSDLERFAIVAAGSVAMYREGNPSTTFPNASAFTSVRVNWHGVNDPVKKEFWLNCFYLVRVYA